MSVLDDELFLRQKKLSSYFGDHGASSNISLALENDDAIYSIIPRHGELFAEGADQQGSTSSKDLLAAQLGIWTFGIIAL